MSKTEIKWLKDKYDSLKRLHDRDNACDSVENYTNGYKVGHTNGQMELIEQLLKIDTGERISSDA